MNSWAGKRACVVGAGISGRAAVDLLVAHGAVVTVVDERAEAAEAGVPAGWVDHEVACHFGFQGVLDEGFDFCVVSPGVSLAQPLVADFQSREIPVWSELELGWQATECPAIAITGTNGKTSVADLFYQILVTSLFQVLGGTSLERFLSINLR